MKMTLLQFYELLLKQDPEHAIILLDTEGRIIAWEGAAERVFGYSTEEMLRQHFAVLFTAEDVQKQMPQYEIDVATNNRQAEDDRWMVRKDGLRFWATGVLIPLKDADGTLLGFGKILRNRSDLKSKTEWLESQLETQRQSNQRKNVFISTLAHELRSPVAAMSSALELLDRVGSQGEESAFARSSIRRQIEFVGRLIEDLLDVTRVVTGKVQLQKELLTIQEVIRAAVQVCRPPIDHHTHDFEVIMEDAPITIEGDRARLQQVFVNLINNAIKYTRYGGRIWVKVSVEAQDAVVKVEDTGIGISPELMPQIFDLFTQAEFESSSQKTGLGIGLAVVKDLVVLHGGNVQVRSDGIGKGSEFTVRLPLKGPDEGRPDRPAN